MSTTYCLSVGHLTDAGCQPKSHLLPNQECRFTYEGERVGTFLWKNVYLNKIPTL